MYFEVEEAIKVEEAENAISGKLLNIGEAIEHRGSNRMSGELLDGGN